jgi:chromate transporter
MGRSEIVESSASPGIVPLGELALIFLKLGTIAFGGPAAHIAMMEDEFVRKRKWITHAEFLDRLAAANLIPGPSSTEVAIFIGQSKRGRVGLLVAGSCFIIPAAVLVCLIAAAYVRFGSLPAMAGILYAIKPAVIAIIVQALWKLAPAAAKTTTLAVIGFASALLTLAEVGPILVLAFAGAASGIMLWIAGRRHEQSHMLFPVLWKGGLAAAVTAGGIAAAPITAIRLFLSFLKIGSVVFGSGYVLLAFLRSEFVDRLHWLTEKQLIDAVAVGQFTPGPVFTTATFVGYIVAGVHGAVLATIGIFLPGFVLVALSGPLLPQIRQSQVASAILDGVVVGALALMAVVAWQLGRASVTNWFTVLIFVASAVAVLRFRVNSAWVIAGAALLGIVVRA